jgi:hypothetical protein
MLNAKLTKEQVYIEAGKLAMSPRAFIFLFNITVT